MTIRNSGQSGIEESNQFRQGATDRWNLVAVGITFAVLVAVAIAWLALRVAGS